MNLDAKLELILKESKLKQYCYSYQETIIEGILDRIINDTIQVYKDVSIDRIEEETENLTEDSAWMLVCFAGNAVIFAHRESNQKYFDSGLIALCIAKNKIDYREILMMMALFYDTHLKTDVVFDNILNRKDSYSEYISLFLNRDERDKTLECMGFKTDVDELGNFCYRRVSS